MPIDEKALATVQGQWPDQMLTVLAIITEYEKAKDQPIASERRPIAGYIDSDGKCVTTSWLEADTHQPDECPEAFEKYLEGWNYHARHDEQRVLDAKSGFYAAWRLRDSKREIVAPSEWYAQRHDKNDGEIQFHAYGPNESFVVFDGVNAKADCSAFMKSVGGTLHGS